MIQFKKDMIAIWIGTSDKSLQEWLKYSNGVEKSKGKTQIEKEIGYIDTDFFGYYATENNEIVPVADLVSEAGTNSLETDENIVKQAVKLGVVEGNRLYYYCNYEFLTDNPTKQLYNDLIFIGNFEDPFSN